MGSLSYGKPICKRDNIHSGSAVLSNLHLNQAECQNFADQISLPFNTTVSSDYPSNCYLEGNHWHQSVYGVRYNRNNSGSECYNKSRGVMGCAVKCPTPV